MPFPFILPTTSQVSFSDFFSSSTHPSLVVSATSARGVFRDVLKKHKRLPPQSRDSDLPRVLDTAKDYLPYLFAFESGLTGRPIAGEEVDITLIKELEVEWRPTLSSSGLPGNEPRRVKLRSLESEIAFVMATMSYTNSLLARQQLRSLYNAVSPSIEQRNAAITAATRHFLAANSISIFLASRPKQTDVKSSSADISSPMLSALASMAMAEATLVAVLKDDPYPAVVADDRNKDNTDWMYKAPSIPKVRAHLFSRICLAAAEHAAKAQADASRATGLDSAIVKYIDALRRTAKAKSCRFLGIDTDLAGSTGEAIAWLRAAKRELGIATLGDDDDQKVGKLSRLKKDWSEKREDQRIEKSTDWGGDAGRFEEGRVLDMLEKKWVKMNDTMNVQLIPPSESLLSKMPSGRDYHTTAPFIPPSLDEDFLLQKRGPADVGDQGFQGGEEDSDDEEDANEPVGAFPGTRSDYPAAGASSYY